MKCYLSTVRLSLVLRGGCLLFFILPLVIGTGSAGAYSLKFTDVTEQVGLTGLQHTTTYSGAVADFNLDGKIDLLICHHGSISLFQNYSGNFVERTNLVPFKRGDMHGVSFIDINNDNYPDIVVSCGANRGRGHGSNLFFLNDHGRRFVFVDNPSPVIADNNGRGRSITPDDYNNDGLIDLLIFNQYQRMRPHRIAIAGKTWGDYTDVGLASNISNIQSYGIKVVNLNGDYRKYYIPTGPGANSNIYLQRGTQLDDVSKQLGINESVSVSIVPFDSDNDGDFDLFYTHRRFTMYPQGAAVINGDIFFRILADMGVENGVRLSKMV